MGLDAFKGSQYMEGTNYSRRCAQRSHAPPLVYYYDTQHSLDSCPDRPLLHPLEAHNNEEIRSEVEHIITRAV